MRALSIHRFSLTVLISLVSAAAASCAKVDADIPDTKVTQKAVSFAGIPGASRAGEVSTTQTFTLTADNLSWAKDMNSDIYAYEVELKAVSGVQDLSFIHYARVTMASGDDPSMTPVEVVNYTRAENEGPGPVLDAKTSSPINVTSVWAAKKVVLTLEIAGILPEQPWSADVTLHMSGKLSYSF